MRRRGTELKARFLSHVVRDASGCHLWAASINKKTGYGKFGVSSGKVGLAHRWAFKLFKGPIPKGKCVLHTCDVRRCVNLDHLFIGTRKDNTTDCIRKGRFPDCKGQKNGHAKFTEEQVLAIRASEGSQNEIARRFNTTQQTVSKFKSRSRWGHL